jgi:hypothetical protein
LDEKHIRLVIAESTYDFLDNAYKSLDRNYDFQPKTRSSKSKIFVGKMSFMRLRIRTLVFPCLRIRTRHRSSGNQ